MAENNFLRKPPLDDGDEQLFRDKLTPDTSFVGLVVFKDTDIDNWRDEEVAIRELNYLKAKKKEIEKAYTDFVEYLNGLYNPEIEKIDEATAQVNTRIQNFVREHAEDIPLEKVEGIERGEKLLGEYKVEITKTVKIKKAPLLKPVTNEPDPDNEEIFSEETKISSPDPEPGCGDEH